MRFIRKQGGFTLIEISLVIAVAAAILLMGINRYFIYRQNQEIAQIEQNVRTIAYALNRYYALNCSSDKKFTVTMKDLTDSGLLAQLPESDLLATEASGYQFSVSATELNKSYYSGKPLYQFTIRAQLASHIQKSDYYYERLNATTLDGKNLSWKKMPVDLRPGKQDDLSISDASLQYFKDIVGAVDTYGDTSCAY